MDSTEITVRERREQRQTGQVVSFTALAPSGRILGVVELQIPLLSSFPLSERIGEEAEQELLKNAQDLVRRVAAGVLAQPTGAGRGNHWLNP